MAAAAFKDRPLTALTGRGAHSQPNSSASLRIPPIPTATIEANQKTMFAGVLSEEPAVRSRSTCCRSFGCRGAEVLGKDGRPPERSVEMGTL
ncbi:MAG TPA: hypothetical protein VMG35_09070, partial [Bryobacteraceae bacterium]|nr:hypothetical protein [Bryobacteraceae bacterium]